MNTNLAPAFFGDYLSEIELSESLIASPQDPIRVTLPREVSEAICRNNRREMAGMVKVYRNLTALRAQSMRNMRDLQRRCKPSEVVQWNIQVLRHVQRLYHRVFDRFTDEFRVGRWLKSIAGIGPVTSAGILSLFDVTRAPTVGHFFSFAGLSPRRDPERSFCKLAKWLIVYCATEYFLRRGLENTPYGVVYLKYKADLDARNKAGLLAEAAARYRKSPTQPMDHVSRRIYCSGHIPGPHRRNWARRYVAKVFVTHVYMAMYEDYYGRNPKTTFRWFEPMDNSSKLYIPSFLPPPDGSRSLRTLRD